MIHAANSPFSLAFTPPLQETLSIVSIHRDSAIRRVWKKPSMNPKNDHFTPADSTQNICDEWHTKTTRNNRGNALLDFFLIKDHCTRSSRFHTRGLGEVV